MNRRDFLKVCVVLGASLAIPKIEALLEDGEQADDLRYGGASGGSKADGVVTIIGIQGTGVGNESRYGECWIRRGTQLIYRQPVNQCGGGFVAHFFHGEQIVWQEGMKVGTSEGVVAAFMFSDGWLRFCGDGQEKDFRWRI